MRWRCPADIFFHRSAVFNRRISALLHLPIFAPESDGACESHPGNERKQPSSQLARRQSPDSSRSGIGIRAAHHAVIGRKAPSMSFSELAQVGPWADQSGFQP
jgi:hypothetical protein